MWRAIAQEIYTEGEQISNGAKLCNGEALDLSPVCVTFTFGHQTRYDLHLGFGGRFHVT